ncbi:MAG: thiamine pyrophosphate-binding protein [Candidatus Poribacteria bacterium]|nr:thiamine pyrophosphate-binding protein [Candidatus Poribacteria bacterium]
MRKTVTGTGGMLLVQALKECGVKYLFTNPGSAETGLFAAVAEDGELRVAMAKHEGLVSAMAEGYHRTSGEVGVVIAHVTGGSLQMAGQLYNAQAAGSSMVVIAGDWTSEVQDVRALTPFPGLSQAELLRGVTKEARCAYQVSYEPEALTLATAKAMREATTPPTGPVYLSVHANLFNQDDLEATIGEASQYRIEGPGPARPETVEAIARKLGQAKCPALIFGDDVWREGAHTEAVRLAELLNALVFSSGSAFPNFPTHHRLYCGRYPAPQAFAEVTGTAPDLLFLVGCRSLYGQPQEPFVIQIGPDPTMMGRHYPLDVAAVCGLKDTLNALCESLPRLHSSEAILSWQEQREKVQTYAKGLIASEEAVVREHEHDETIHPSLLEAQMAEQLPRNSIIVSENPTARTTLLPFGYEDMWRFGPSGGSLGWGVGGAIGAKMGIEDERPVILSIGDGSLTYSAVGFWSMARYNTAVLTIVSNNESYQVVRQNWAREAPKSQMTQDGKYPGLFLGGPSIDYVELAHAQGVDGERVTRPQELNAALKRGIDAIVRENRPYLLDVAVAREGLGAESDWYQGWKL